MRILPQGLPQDDLRHFGGRNHSSKGGKKTTDDQYASAERRRIPEEFGGQPAPFPCIKGIGRSQRTGQSEAERIRLQQQSNSQTKGQRPPSGGVEQRAAHDRQGSDNRVIAKDRAVFVERVISEREEDLLHSR